MRVRMVFMVLDVVCCEVPAWKIPACGAGVRIPVCHGVAVKLAVRPDDRAVQSGWRHKLRPREIKSLPGASGFQTHGAWFQINRAQCRE